MADGADAKAKLSKLARLKSLKSGMKASEKASEDDSASLSLEDMLGDEAPEAVAEIAAPASKAAQAPKPEPAKTPKPAPNAAEKDGESLSSYFEALGIVPDNGKVDGATGKAPTSYSAPSDEYTTAASKTEPGREVDERDLWADPVRNDDTFLSSFAAGTADSAVDPEPEEDMPSLESIIGSFEDDEGDAPPVTPEPELEAAPEPEMTSEPIEKPVDIEAFEAEIALNDSEIDADESIVYAGPPPEEAEEEVQTDQPLTITFDESRATLLAHVSKQMSCSIDDVVVTAIDWYLDALFGEEDPDMAANQGD